MTFQRSAKCSSTTSAFFVLTVFLCALATSCLCDGETDSDLTTAATVQPNVSYVAKLREFIGNAMDGASPRLARKVLEADLSVDCSIGLFKLVRGIRNLDPWAMRLFDASGKYPTGALSTTRVDLGAFDECVETVVHDDYGRETARAQYCNLMAYAGNKTDLDDHITEAVKFSHPRVPKFREHVYEQRVPILRLGICVLDACSERELNSLLKAVLPRIVDVTITNCVTSIPPEITKTQRIILACLGALTLLIALGTAVDLCCSSSKEKGAAKNILLSVVTSFSVVSNTRMMLNIPTDKTSDSYSMKFLHGIRFWSIVWVLVGHSYGAPSDVWSRMVNVIIYAEKWQNVITTVGFMSVDCFFFLSGFLLAYVVCKQKRTGIVLFLFATIRRLIRTMAPVFFLIMVLHLMPLITSGPDAKSYFDKVHTEFQRQWLLILLQVQNYDFDVNANSPVFGHLWYLSLDFQFFLVSLPVLLLLKSRPRLAVAAFGLLSLISCSVATWQVAGNEMTPFILPVTESLTTFLKTGFHYYFYPFYHAVCYFAGCMTFFFVAELRQKKMSKVFQTAAWCVAIACGLCCIFMKVPWYQAKDPTTEAGKLSIAFFDRILWSLCWSWITFACATGRGGFFNTFLSWSAFTPLSRLTFGVYIIHLPFLQLSLHIARERLFFSHFFVVSFFFTILVWSYLLSYLLFIFCEAPTGKLDKLIFEPRRKQADKEEGNELPKTTGAQHKLPCAITSLTDTKFALPVLDNNSKEVFNEFHYKNGNVSCQL
ncbi:nose resistant to fluoxetine protein 6 isoform X2 [Dermacentor silvarum]|uniref:nose resistant to fluoxetine protein 6 isoform X2 n=1 Tax=Dermacentor silvarum TaxID=543639 RepID=UPI00189BCD32|nr:nose resistant to fluoxetine protein 6 isoform X2 [Dermacentor silvarum]